MRILLLLLLWLSAMGNVRGETKSTGAFDLERHFQLQLSRGEHYLIQGEYKKALESFTEVSSHLQLMSSECSLGLSFRAVLGQIISYDHLQMSENVSQGVQQLRAIISHMESAYCPCQGSNSTSHAFDSSSCEEIVVGAGKALEVFASLVQNSTLQTILVAIIDDLVKKAVSCCQSGNFWQACVSPIVNIWKEWKDNPEALSSLADTSAFDPRLQFTPHLQDVPMFYTGNPLKGLRAFACILPYNIPNKEQINQAIEQELGSIGKIIQGSSDDTNGFSSGNVLTLQIGSLTTFDEKELPITRVTLSIETPVTVDKTKLKSFPRVWSINCFIDSPSDQIEDKLLGAVQKLFKEFVQTYQLVNQDALKPTFHIYY